MHQMGEVGLGTYFSIVSLMIGKLGDFTLSLSMFLLEFQRGEGDDVMIWQLNRSGTFHVRSFYKSLLKAPFVSFPWQSNWCVKVPKRVSFFLWTAARGGILPIENLVKKNLPLVNWCCLSRCDEETMDHLLLYCKFASALWSEVLIMFGV